MKTFVLVMLLVFSSGSMLAQQNLSRSTFISGCQEDAPDGFTVEQVQALYQSSEEACADVTPEVTITVTMDGDDCSWTKEITYDVKCGSFEEQFKLDYFGGDEEAPSLNNDAEVPTGGTNLNLCYSDIPAGPTAAEVAALYSDNCGTPVIVSKSGSPEGDDCAWSVTYKYTIQDQCGNFAADLDILYSGGDTQAPILDKNAVLPQGESGVNLCFDEKLTGPTEEDIAALYNDNCSAVFVTKTENSKGTDCKWLAIYTYTIQDACGNFADPIVLTYQGGDTEDPEIFGVPADITIDCIDDIPAPSTEVFATDNCADKPELLYNQDMSEYGDNCTGGIIKRIYTAIDDCERTTVQEQIITVLPAPISELTAPEFPETISCEDANNFSAPDANYSNGLTKGSCALSGSIQPEIDVDYDECGGTITVSYDGVDECDTVLSAGPFVINVEPAPMAQFDEVQGLSITCEDAALYEASPLAYTNGGTGVCEIAGEVEGELSGSYNECGGTLFVDWSYTDKCGRTITAQKEITVEPAPMAQFDAVEDMEITCEEANVLQPGSLSYTNGGTGACEISGSVEGELSGSYDECGGVLEIDWSFTDNCDRTITAKKTITVLPAPMASFEDVQDITISCEEANSFAAGTLSYTNGGTGACEISGSVEGELSGSYNECGGNLEIDWTYTDDCDRTINAKQYITVEPAPAAEFEPVQDMTISCEEANSFEPGSLSYTNGGTGACEISGSVQGELSGEYNECGGTLEVDWTFTDECGRTIDAKKVITVEPAPAAEFEPVSNITISCEEANEFQAGSLSYTNNGTGACEISGSVQGELTGSYDECGGLLFVNWSFTDECGRTIQADQQIKVNPAPAATFDEVEDLEISCEEANEFQAGSLSYTNNGTGACEISGSVQGELSGTYDECGGTLFVDWTFTDNCDRSISAQQTITVLPAPMAAFDEVDDITISCEEANVFQAGSLSYTNNGTGACEISGSVDGELSGSYTECGGTLQVDWTFTDKCDRTINATQIVTVEPAPMAAFDEVDDITISCEEANVYQAGSLGYTNGGTGLCEISGSVEGELSGSYTECGGTLEVDWTFTDACDRTITAKQIITVEPAPMAAFDEVDDITISCEEANVYQAGSLGYTNGGTGACEISGIAQGELSGEYNECGGTLYVDWSFTDNCERTITAQQVITVLPAPMAEFEPVEDMEITCEEANVFEPGTLSYTNNGTGACLIAGEAQGELSGEYNECGGTLEVDWIFIDNCQRTITAKKVITVLPAPMAEFEPVVDMTVTCEEADAIVNQTLVEDFTNPGEFGGFEGLASAALTADPQDGNNQVLELISQDAGNPWQGAGLVNNYDLTNTKSMKFDVLSDQAFDILAKLEGEGLPASATAGSYTNVGQWQTLTVTFDQALDNTQVAADAAYSLLALFPNWNVGLNGWNQPPGNFTIYVDNIVIGGPGCLSYTNGGTGACEISGEVAGELSGEYNECGGTLEVDYSYTDNCGRTITAKKTITVEPAPMASFDPVEDMTVSCEEAAGIITNATIVQGFVGDFASGNWSQDLGGSDGSINITETDMTIVGGNNGAASVVIAEATCPESGNYSFSWDFTTEDGSAFWDPAFYVNGVAVIQLTDDNEGAQSGSISVNCAAGDVIGFGVASQDGIAGAATLTISDFTVGGTFLNYNNGGTGVCEISGSVPAELSGEYDECGGTLFLDWTYTDNCNRTITAQKVITVEPAPMAEFDEVEDITITCEQANLYEPQNLAYSNGGTGLCEIAGEVMGELSGSYNECGGTLEVDWTFTDKCDRTITAKKVITVEPAPAAEFEPVDNIEISCEQANTFAPGSLMYSNGGTGACEISGTVPGELSGTYDECGGTLLVDWTFTDLCNRTITAQQVVTVLPAPAAEFEPVEDMTISCEEANVFQPGTLAYTNNGTGLCLIAGEAQGELSGEYNECGGTLEVDWTFTDNCGRTIDAKKVITVEPAPMAAFEPVEDMTISCEEANVFQPGTLSYTNNGTGPCLIAGEVQGELSGEYNECGGTLEVDWTYTDNCGRTIDAKKVITVEPAPMAAFEPVEDMTISCEEANVFEPGSLSYTNNGTGPCLIAGEVQGELSGEYDECGGTLEVDWTYTDNCGRTIDAKKVITVEPAPMAAFEPVENMTVSCEEAALVGTTFVTGFTGDFAPGNWSQDLGGSDGSINITETDMTIVGGNNGSGSVVIAEATCPTGGSYSFNWDFTTDDGSAFWDPAFYVNGVAVIQLTDDNEGAQSGSVSVNCAAGDVIGFGVASQDGIAGAGTLTITDFTVGEATMLSYTNNGTGACEISGSVPAELSGSYDECGGTLYLDWSYTDDCGRTITAQKVVTVEPAPEAEFAPIEDASIACEDLATYEPEFLSYTNGGTGACEISGEVQGEAELFEGSCGTFEVDFTFTDDCGRTITAKQIITVIDETAPVQVGEIEGGESFVNACFEERPEGPSIETIAAAFEDNCGNVNVTKEETVVENSDCQWAVFYVYTISDDCGNFANNVKISYFGGDYDAPQLTGNLPTGTEGLQCLADNPGVPEDVVAQITAAYTEDCGEVIVTPLDPIFTGDDCDWTVTYEFTVQDSCGNYADNVVIVNKGSDTIAPVYNGELDDTFTNTTLCFDSELGEPTADEMKAMFSDNCDQDLTITKTVQAFGSDCQWLKVFIYTAEDDCGNVSEPVKINYEGLDEEAPQPTGQCDNEVMTIGTEMGADCPQDAAISLQVGDEISADDNSWSVAGITVADMNGTLVPCFTDNCADVSELTYRVIDKGEDKSDCSTTLTVTFEVEDLCENVSEPFVCTFIIVDDTAPVVECPEDVDFGLVDDTPTGLADKANYTDNCQPDGQTQDFSDVQTSETIVTDPTPIDGCDGPFTFQGFDSFGDGWNGYSVDVLVNGQPVITDYTFDTGSAGDPVAIPAAAGDLVSVVLNQGGTFASEVSYDITNGANEVLASGGVSNNFITDLALCTEGGGEEFILHTLIRTFTANDGCDNYDECSVTYTWLTPPPTPCELALPIACGESVDGSTEGAQVDEDLEFCGTSLNSAPGVWYVLAGTGDVLNVNANTFGSDFDTKLGVFSGSCDALVCVGGNDDSGSLQSSVDFQSEVGVDYYIYVTGFASNAGDYTLTVSCEVACLADAGTLTAVEDTVNLDQGLAALSAIPDGNANEPAGFATVFVLTSGPGLAIVDAGATPDFVVDAEGLYTIHTLVYDPNTLDPLSLPLDGSVSGFDVLDLINGQGLCASLDAAGAPINVIEPSTCDIEAIQEVVCGSVVAGNTGDGGPEDVQPGFASFNGLLTGNWYTFTGTGDPMVIFSTCNAADYDTRIIVTTDCGQTIVGENDDNSGAGCSGFTSLLEIPTTAGVVYEVFVTGFSATSVGSYELTVACGNAQQARAYLDTKVDFTAYPVPFDHEVNIAYSFEFDTKVTIEVFDTKGLLVLTETDDNYVTGSDAVATFDLSRYANQLFYVKLTTNQGSVTKKIVSSGKK
ncbi:T9SS type A sorting domain-containing protein [Psychroserpens sp.]|uniref:T9SS type A sorting domain-containing protein n=1 Tax=Psychroserpens sp. TaxID=2020870 RepID=UPI001B018158|nr:T9SS type A sorting domain-containing protein [Psychroserpens sp.]MBO6607093.1 T9SS type A sorting domain-containing protein [Psychroserpens sp.]MBO6654239.1 T9SS type A sorting domain-containing protein [Psychroserpens sp.]MBO6682475.1 T9SS type A sorting domain-containing protein [Psychroserpens sp.]MBO6750865.1 T9SS type A sorting domain-containing protein [Psychroserpens sp.]MBO6915706.1 T9SS type A sorting domain-containing protein [Psychroserpens sp.]